MCYNNKIIGQIKRLSIEDNDIIQLAIQNEILHWVNSGYDNKLHAILIVSKDYNWYEVGGMFGYDPITVSLKKWNSGAESLIRLSPTRIQLFWRLFLFN